MLHSHINIQLIIKKKNGFADVDQARDEAGKN